MPGTTMIGECRYSGPGGSVLPPEARHAKRLLRSLNSARLAASALLDAVGMVTVRLPMPPGDPIVPPPAPSSASGASAAAADVHSRAVAAATASLRSVLRDSFGDVRSGGGGPPGGGYEAMKEMVVDRMGLALYLAAERAVDVGLDYMESASSDSKTGELSFGGTRKRRRAETESTGVASAAGAAAITSADESVTVDHAAGTERSAVVTEGSSCDSASGSLDGASGNCRREESDGDDDKDYARPDDGNDRLGKKRSLEGRSSIAYDDDGDDETNRPDTLPPPQHDHLPADEAARNRTKSIQTTLASALESLHLQVASRTTATWGRKKMYEVYDLPGGPVRPVCGSEGVRRVREAVEREFRASYRGGGEDRCGVRVYALLRRVQRSGGSAAAVADDNDDDDDDGRPSVDGDADTYLYLQLSIGKQMDLNDESLRAANGQKLKKLGNEFVAVVRPGTSHVALTAGRAPSRSRYSPFVLAALTGALCSNGGGGGGRAAADSSLVARRVGDLSGTEPYDLLASAASAADRTALGRFSRYASGIAVADEEVGAVSATVAISDPLLEMNEASTGTLVGRGADRARLEVGARHGRGVAHLATNITASSGGASSLLAANGAGVIVDHSAASARAMKNAGDDELGRKGDCPMLQRVCWKWSGETSAASLCWQDDTAAFESGESKAALPTTKFKCGVVMEGPDVFEGLRALVAAGVAKAPLPNHVRDAPGMGSTTITVADGEFGGAESLAAV